ncbi:MAG TPA: CapA family protein [Thermoanaerobaculia bacterium]|nr:CapA family protein [Thermoanaerobaculia bacterium]
MDRRDFLKGAARAAAAASAVRPFRTLAAAAGEPRMTLTAAGDCLVARRVSGLRDPRFFGLLEILRSADCRWGNCELPIADAARCSPAPKGEDPVVIAEPWAADELRWTGFNLMALANNHTLDWGVEGMRETIANLDRVGIVHAGAGEDLAHASRPGYLDTEAGRVALVSCASTFPEFFKAAPASGFVPGRPGLNPLHVDRSVQLPADLFDKLESVNRDLDTIQGFDEFDTPEFPVPKPAPGTGRFDGTTIRKGSAVDVFTAPAAPDVKRIAEALGVARNNARVVIASIHAHESGRKLELSDKFLPAFAHACVDAGADLYLSSGPHVVRGIEIYKGKPIFYSLGNFYFQYESDPLVPPEELAAYGLDAATADPWQLNRKILYWAQPRFWRSFVPRITFAGSRVTKIEIFPITMGFGLPVDRRGTPVLASRDDAESILHELAELSRPYGTEIRMREGMGEIALG